MGALDLSAALTPISKGIQIGIDIGQRVDPSAIVVAEAQQRDYTLEAPELPPPAIGAQRIFDQRRSYTLAVEPIPTGGEQHYVIRHIERLPLGTPYPKVAERLAEIYGKLIASGHAPQCFADATGVGLPVVDLLTAAGVPVIPVFLTGGERETFDGREIHLAKTRLVSRLQVLLQTRRVHLPDTDDARALQQELLDFEIKVTEAANLQFGAFKIGSHDDLAVALGLATRDSYRYRPQTWW
jgi:hypothetical protein